MDLLIVVITILLFVTWGIIGPPLLGRRHCGGHRIACVSNQKQIGLAARMWANDNGDKFPGLVTEPIRADDTDRVLRFALTLTNELNTPKVLYCPQDTNRQRVATWDQLTSTNISYFLALGAENANAYSLLGGDRNVAGGIALGAKFRIFMTNTPAEWSSELHNGAGNLLLADGSVQQVNSSGLWKALRLETNRIARLALP